ncbi:MAG: chemotaxis-specific protein-glutamate methyltransferase CheB [Desulforhopalus sp.]|nr:chemotaxis-specific protein-glutamate methyltransferase CheB [Desulforhopalus sp.]
MIKVLVVEDSPVARELLIHILRSDPGIEVIGSAKNGREAVEFVACHKPDLVTMDIYMPEMDGFEASRCIMENTPVPIVMVTASPDMQELDASFRAIETGALTILQKPQGPGHPNYTKHASTLISTVKLMSEIKVVKRWPRTGERLPQMPLNRGTTSPHHATPMEIVAIGASTGGPPVIEKILAALPHSFPLPILIVQHMAEGFVQGFAEWLGQTSTLPVQVPVHGSITRPGHVYLAPDGVQMRIDVGRRLSCQKEDPENGLRPAVSCLFRSVAEVFGKKAVGVLLTGMGRDGASELKLLRDKGAVTIAQNEETSAVYGMPGEAVKLDAARYILPADKIAALLTGIAIAGTKNQEATQRSL